MVNNTILNYNNTIKYTNTHIKIKVLFIIHLVIYYNI